MNVFEYMQEGRWLAVMSVMSFSLCAGWCMGFALKTILRIALLVVGVILLAIFGLWYVEIIPSIDVERMASLFKSGMSSAKDESVSFFNWTMQQLPTASAGIAGFSFGFNRK